MSQVNFFMSEADETEFLDFVMGKPEAAILAGRFHDSRTPVLLREAPAYGTVRELELVRTDIRSPVVLTASGKGDFEGKYLLDMFRDPHIEFGRCYLSNGRLERGRIYTKIGGLPTAAENDAMHKWYNSLAGWLKRRYRRVTQYYWLGPGAEAWVRSGGITAERFSLEAARSDV